MTKKYIWSKLKNGAIWLLKNSYKGLIAVGGASAGVAAVTVGSPLLAVAGASAVASTISSVVKDKNIKPIMKLVNLIACNIDKAKNDEGYNK